MTVYGELDMSTAADLRQAVAEALRMEPPDVELDLAGVSFADSAGIRCLLMCRAAAERAGSRIRLSHPRPEVHRVLELTGALAIFDGRHPVDPGPRQRGDSAPAQRPANATVVDARAIRQAAQEARERAQRMRREDEARRARIRAARGA
jgi:anti-sigma B factor antagonist